jgi:NADH-quinone oxidoreductase subunit N
MTAITRTDLLVLAPAIALLGTAMAVLLVDAAWPRRGGRLFGGVALGGVALAVALAYWAWGNVGLGALGFTGRGALHTSSLILDGYARYVSWIVLLAAGASAAVSIGYAERWRLPYAEYYALLLVAAAGMIGLSMANELVVLFLTLETFSLCLYVLCGLVRGSRAGLEAATKYFVMGSVAAAFLLYGTGLAYAATGTTYLDAVAAAYALHGAPATMAAAALGLLLVGLAFKAAIVPFHQWAPDAYDGAPTPVTGFMAAATKAAAFAALGRVLWTGFGPLASNWVGPLAVVAVVSMVVGNLAALVQSDLKRMLGYSAVAQAGYVLAALLAGTSAGVAAALYYLLAYALMNLGVIAVLVGLGVRPDGRDATNVEDIRGLAGRHPGLALALAIFLLALAGMPPTAGFVGKWYIFDALVSAGRTPLAVAVVLNSVLSVFYYARPVFYAYAGEARPTRHLTVATPTAIVVATTALVVGLGALLSGPLLAGARSSGNLSGVKAATAGGQTPGLIFTAPSFQKGGK